MTKQKKISFIQTVGVLTKKYETNQISLEEYRMEMAFVREMFGKKQKYHGKQKSTCTVSN